MCTAVVCALIYLLVIFGQASASWEMYSNSHIAEGPIIDPSLRINHHVVLKKCKYQICNDAGHHYPEKEINEAMKRQHTLKSLLGGTVFNASSDTFVVSRQGEATTRKNLCDTIFATQRPKVMRNLDGDLKIIVNTDMYEQKFGLEACRDLEVSDSKNLCTHFKRSCKQKYQPMSLIIYDEGTIRFDRFPIPTSCYCSCEECMDC